MRQIRYVECDDGRWYTGTPHAFVEHILGGAFVRVVAAKPCSVNLHYSYCRYVYDHEGD